MVPHHTCIPTFLRGALVGLAFAGLPGALAAEAQQRIGPERQRVRSVEVRRQSVLRVGTASQPPDDTCQAEMRPARRPKMVFLNYFWYRKFEFECTMMRPKTDAIDSRDTDVGGYYDKRFRRLKKKGVDVLGFVFTGFEKPDDDIAGQVPHTAKHGRNLKNAISRAEDAGLPFFIYYDLAIRTAVKSHLCNVPEPIEQHSCRKPEHTPITGYDLTDPVIFPQLRQDFVEGSYPARFKSQEKRVRAICHADAISSTDVFREFFLEFLNLLPKDVPSAS